MNTVTLDSRYLLGVAKRAEDKLDTAYVALIKDLRNWNRIHAHETEGNQWPNKKYYDQINEATDRLCGILLIAELAAGCGGTVTLCDKDALFISDEFIAVDKT